MFNMPGNIIPKKEVENPKIKERNKVMIVFLSFDE